MNKLTRKDFLKASLAGCSVAMLAPGRVAAAIAPRGSPNGDVRVAIVGLNGRGGDHIDEFVRIPGVKIAALCDVDSAVLAKRAGDFETKHYKVTRYADYRKLLEDGSIDAVVIATPNHWHSLMTVWACQAGKDVYVEKPISHNVWEGRKAVEAAQKYNRIVQTGTQSRSDPALQQAAAYLQAGNLGKAKWARGLCYKLRESLGKTSGPQPVPPTVDYDLWSGPAPLVPPRRNTSRGTIHYDWHWFWNYGGGDIANQGIHQMDVARWLLEEQGLPPTATGFGGRYVVNDDGETPNSLVAVLDYAAAPLIFEVRGLPMRAGVRAMDAYRGARVGVVVQYEGGYFAPGESGGGGLYDNEHKKIKQFSSAGGGTHMANFIGAVRSRKPSDLAAPIEVGHISSSLCHLANISYRLGQEKSNEAIREQLAAREQTEDSFARLLDNLRANNVDVATTPMVLGPTLRLAPGTERFATRERYDLEFWGNTLLTRQYRKPFVVPEQV